MTADEIRRGADTFRDSMKRHAKSGEGPEIYRTRALGAQVEVLMEIAAQLAELNERQERQLQSQYNVSRNAIG